MKSRSLLMMIICIAGIGMLAGCAKGGSSQKPEVSLAEKTEKAEESDKAEEEEETESEETEDTDDTQESDVKPEKKREKKSNKKAEKAKEEESKEKSLARRMTGKYSYHAAGENGESEYYIMDVVNFGDNLYAFCGRAMADDDETLEAYTFWACEFIPYDAREMASSDGDSVRVNELNFSIMSNVGKYWDAGHTGTITLTDDGLVFDGFDHDGFLVPDYDDSRLFLKDKRAGDAFTYLKHDKGTGDKELQGYWVSSGSDGDLYIRFSGTDMYIYMKNLDREVVLAAGGCDFYDGSFDCIASYIQAGGMPFEFSADYKVDEDRLTLDAEGSDLPDRLVGKCDFDRIAKGDIHVTTMDEVVFDEDSFGPYGQMEKEPFYGVWINAFKKEADARALVKEITDKGLPAFSVYSCDWENLNKEPYYCVTVGKAASESEAKSYMEDAKKAGYKSAYIKYTGNRIN